MSEPLRILHLEDNPVDVELVSSLLKEAGIVFDLTAVQTKTEFLDAITTKKFDLIISDFSLPSFNGGDALLAVKERTPETPFIFVSGTIGEEIAIESLHRGATDYVLKTRLARLVPAVSRALREADEKKKLRLAEKMREMALEDLKVSEARFRGVLESAPDAVVITDSSNKITFVNGKTEDVFGYKREELLGKPLSVLVPDRFKRTHDMHTKDFAGTPHGRPLNTGIELFARRKNGTEFPADIMLSPLGMNDELSVLAMVRDISAAKEAEKALRESEQRYRNLVDGARDGIFSISLNAVIQSLNPAFETITGWKREEWLGKSFTDLLHPDDREKAGQMFKKLIKGGVPGLNQYRILKKGGGHLTGEFNTTLLVHDGKKVGILGIARDVTSQIMLEEQLRQSQKLESIGTLAGGIAHDFNNILGIILGFTTLMKRNLGDTERQEKNLDLIADAAQRGVALVRQLLMFSRKQEKVVQTLNVNEIIREVSKLIGETFPKVISIQLDLCDDPVVIRGDHTEMHQAILNLCVNARDAMMDRTDGKLAGGSLRISSTRMKRAQVREYFPTCTEEEYARISFSDTGIGMDTATIGRMFEPFFTTKERGKGTGLGLSMVYGIVNTHDGFIDVKSSPGSGTDINIFLPINEGTGALMTEAEVEISKIRQGSETILVVEDEAGLRELLEDALTHYGYKVITAADGQRAIALFLAYRNIQLVLSDIGLPSVGGVDLSESLKKLNPQVKIILASGFVEEAEKRNMLGRGVNRFIQKPYRISDVLVTIREVLDGE